jgi:hypothetical protein
MREASSGHPWFMRGDTDPMVPQRVLLVLVGGLKTKVSHSGKNGGPWRRAKPRGWLERDGGNI